MKELRLCADETMDTKLTIPSRAPEVWEQHERDGHMPKFPDCPVCVQSSISAAPPIACIPCYFLAAGLRVQHEDKIMLVPFFIRNKTGLTVSQEVFQLVDYIATCKQLQAFHGSRVRILSDQRTEFVNQEFEKHARQRGIHLAISLAHQPQSHGAAERLVGLATVYTSFASSCRASRFLLELCHAVCCRDASS